MKVILSVPDDGYSRITPCALNLIFAFLFSEFLNKHERRYLLVYGHLIQIKCNIKIHSIGSSTDETPTFIFIPLHMILFVYKTVNLIFAFLFSEFFIAHSVFSDVYLFT
jgi:hypothetical protein